MAKKFLIDDQSNDYGKARKKSCDSMLKTKTKCFAIDNCAEADEHLLGTIIIVISAGHQDKTAKQQTLGASRHLDIRIIIISLHISRQLQKPPRQILKNAREPLKCATSFWLLLSEVMIGWR